MLAGQERNGGALSVFEAYCGFIIVALSCLIKMNYKSFGGAEIQLWHTIC